MNFTKSAKLYEQAQTVIPGGVNSPVRAFKSVGGKPLFVERAEGPYLYDADGNRYIDYVLSYGPLILGHAHPEVVEALQLAATRGTSYGAPTQLETELAALVCEMVPSAEQVRFVNSGTEATMSVLRLARAYTGRDKIIKLQGNYHGHADFLLVQAGSGVATLGLPDSPGVPKAATQDTLTAPYNNLNALETLFNEYGNQIAALIMEPVCGNIGCVPPLDGYLAGVRALCDQHNALLIFDEVMTGFRVSLGGAQAYYNVTPDLTALGKVIGGGLPVGAYAGRRDIMQTIAPVGPMYQAGTLSGNPLAMTAGIATLNILKRPGVFEGIVERTTRMAEGVGAAAEAAGIAITQTQVGTMFSVFFNPGPIADYETVAQSDTDRFTRFFWAMIDNGVYLAPSQFEAGFFSMAHTDDTVAATVEAAQKAFAAIA